MRFRIQVLICLFFIAAEAHSQSDFRPGYIVKPGGEIIHGLIDYRGELLMSKICRFRLNKEDSVTILNPDEITEYKFDDSKYYVSREVNGQKLFLEFLIKGAINIFSVRDRNGDHFFIEKPGFGLAELPYEEGIKYKDDIPYKWESTTHIGLLSYYMQDAGELRSRITKIHKPKEKWLVDLAEDYHHIVCKEGECIAFERRLPFIKVNLELTAGLNYSVPGKQEESFYYERYGFQKKMQGGIMANFWLPAVNEKLYLRTGLIYTSYEFNGISRIYQKFPIQIEYIYPRGIINPKLAYGINLYRPFNYSVTFMPGINLRLSKTMGLEVNCDLDFLPSRPPFIPSKFYSYDILTGFYINL